MRRQMNPPSPETVLQHQPDSSLTYAGFGVRLAAYLIDVIPITLLTATVFYLFFGFDENLERYFNRAPDDIDARIEFLSQRNQIRDLSFVAYLLYCAVLEGTALRGTVGKWLLGMQVVDDQGRPLTVGRSFGRNCAKMVSYFPCALGFIWALWSDRHRAWHDSIARTLVIR